MKKDHAPGTGFPAGGMYGGEDKGMEFGLTLDA
jgi:hypothetical protein